MSERFRLRRLWAWDMVGWEADDEYTNATPVYKVSDVDAHLAEVDGRMAALEKQLMNARRRVNVLRKARRDDWRHIDKLHRIIGDWRRWFEK